MKLHLIILAALIALAASDAIDDCYTLCDNDPNEKFSQYCMRDGFLDCYKMVPQCTMDEIECIAKILGRDPRDVIAIIEDNCKDKGPKCVDPPKNKQK